LLGWSVVQPPHHGRVYGMRCIRCGNGLELPQDVRLLHIDCPYCGQDNLLPADLVQARQRQFELEQRQYALHMQEQERIRLAHDKERARKHSSQRLVIWLVAGGLMFFALVGSCIGLGYYASREQEAAAARAKDPSLNGYNAVLARVTEMQIKQGCKRILVQPKMHVSEASTVSLDMVKGDQCVHILGMTGQPANLTMQYMTTAALTQPLPQPGPAIDYRLCAAETATHTFKIEAVASGVPFSTAAIECPRLPAEGGARSSADDKRKNGSERVRAMMDELLKAGCKEVSEVPQVARGSQTITVTSPDNAACYNMVAASFFSDVKLSATLSDPNGNTLPVPAPDSKLRIEYCAPKAGKYQVVLDPSTGDHFAWAGIDCNRFGPEGLKRLKALKK
jgi:hypothetical protein